MKKKLVLLGILVPSMLLLNSCEKEECVCEKDPVDNTPVVAVEKTLVMQPDAAKGQDAVVSYREGGDDWADYNSPTSPELIYSTWTYYAEGQGQGTNRVFIKFDEVSTIPSDATIISAKLSLYGIPTSTNYGNSHYSGSPYIDGRNLDNIGLIKRVTENWEESTITWNNQPSSSEEDLAMIPSSTSRWDYDAVDLDVTKLVEAMVKGKKNYGFNIQLKEESIYKEVIFSSSDVKDAAKHPKLVVVYKK